MKTLPLFYYPTTLLFVDDNSSFLKSVDLLFEETNPTILFTSAKETLAFLSSYRSLLHRTSFIKGTTESEHYDLLDCMPVDFEFSALKGIRDSGERQSEVAVMIADYNMPEMNGIELCRELRHLPTKKILLTGQAELSQVVDAFNDRIIDGYIRKGTQGIGNEIMNHVEKLTQQYFTEATKSSLDHLEADYVSPFSDPIFISFFTKWCTSNSINEFYLIDKNWNLLVIDKHGNQSYFVIHTDRTLEYLIELYRDDIEAQVYLRSIILRERIPFFGEGAANWEIPQHRWAESFYKPQILLGREKYYWALIPK